MNRSYPRDLLIILAVVSLAVASAFGIQRLRSDTFGVSLPSGSALFETSLQDRITTSDTSMSLVANSLRGSEVISGYNCFTIDEGRSDSEFVCGTVSGTSVTALERGLSFTTGTTSVAALKFAHRKGANVKITDYPLIQRIKAILSGQDTIPSLLSYTSGTDCSAGHSSAVLCTGAYLEAYANNVIAGGSPTSTATVGGKVLLATQVQQASSTDLGANAPLVITSKFSTSSPGGTAAARYNLILNELGKIAQTAIDFTGAYVWTGLHSFSGGLLSTASSTISATTTIAASSATSTALILNTIPYGFPVIQGSANQVLQNNGGGLLSWTSAGKVAFATTSQSYNTAATTWSFASTSVPANTLGTSGGIRIRAYVNTLDMTTAVTNAMGCKYGGTTVATQNMNGSASTPNQFTGYVECVITANGTNNQQGVMLLDLDKVNGAAGGTAALGIHAVAVGTAAASSAAAQTLELIYTAADSNATNGITVKFVTVEKIQ